MSARDITLELAMRALVPLVRAVSPVQPKLRRAVGGADTALDVIHGWSRAQRDTTRPLVWVHAPSVGEALMAQAIMRELRNARPDLQLFFTHLSPSAERMRDRVGADGVAYLPWDTPAAMQAALAALRPSAIVFVRTEIWPALTRSAHAQHVPVFLLNAVLPAGSSRLKPLARFALRPAHERLSRVGAINEAAALRFQRLGVPAQRIAVTGDARFDQVAWRVAALDRESELLRRLRSDRFTIVAGSTWPADEEHLLPAFSALHRLPARLIIAPHEPTPAALQRIEAACQARGLVCQRLSTLNGAADVIAIDQMGVLADAYLLADVAYVGGAFHNAGVHSVVEPAALGVPVVIGPRHANAVEAQQLIDAGGAASIADAGEFEQLLERLRADPVARTAMGGAALAFVQSKLGAARANAEVVLRALNSAS